MSVPALASNRVNVIGLEVEQIGTDLTDLSNFVYTLSGAVQQLILNDLSDELYDLSNRTSTLSGSVDSLRATLTDISLEVDVILPDVNGISGRLDGLSLEFESSKNVFAGLSGDLYILESQVLSLSNDLTSLDGQVGTLTGYTYDLGGQFTNLSGYSYGLGGQVSTISGKLIDLSNYVNSFTPATPTLQQVLTAGNSANNIGINGGGDSDFTFITSYSGLSSANDSSIAIDAGNGTGIIPQGGVIDAYQTLNPSVPKNLLLQCQYGKGNVGIGQTSPSYTLDVSGTSRVSGNAIFDKAVGISTTDLDNSFNVKGIIQIQNYNTGNEKFGIYSFDNVLQINPRTSTGAYRGINSFSMDNSGKITIPRFQGNIGMNRPADATNVLSVSGIATISQRLGVGDTSSPFGSELLTIQLASSSASPYVNIKNGATGYGAFFGTRATTGIFGLEQLDAKQIILVTTPNTPGNRYEVLTCNPNRTVQINGLTTNGTVITTNANGTLAVSSDRRAKKNIVYRDDISGLHIVNHLRPAEFSYNWEDNDRHLGFITQDVEEYLPEAVDGKKYRYEFKYTISGEETDIHNTEKVLVLDSSGNPVMDETKPRYAGLDSNALIAVLVKSVQELSKEIEILKTKLP